MGEYADYEIDRILDWEVPASYGPRRKVWVPPPSIREYIRKLQKDEDG